MVKTAMKPILQFNKRKHNWWKIKDNYCWNILILRQKFLRRMFNFDQFIKKQKYWQQLGVCEEIGTHKISSTGCTQLLQHNWIQGNFSVIITQNISGLQIKHTFSYCCCTRLRSCELPCAHLRLKIHPNCKVYQCQW